MATKLNRLACNTKEGIEVIKSLFQKGVRVHVLSIGLLENATMGKFFLTTLLAIAEMERNLIKVLAKQCEDFREGRPRKHYKHCLERLE